MTSTLKLSLFIVLVLASCQKDYQCMCTTVVNGETTTAINTIYNTTASKAKIDCESVINGPNQSVTTCALE
jgi:hypothetical protein